MALPADLTTFEPMPAFPADFTNGAWTQYTLDLQTALKIDIDKLGKIKGVQPDFLVSRGHCRLLQDAVMYHDPDITARWIFVALSLTAFLILLAILISDFVVAARRKRRRLGERQPHYRIHVPRKRDEGINDGQ
ncbi:MAG: hypothetical protein B7Z66_15955 [Chromatiales bacterium 21-64-14]|nr:MAG: hypothetical protein B7Z66_15955 [Chromatiales bacterium 21-64-14]